MFSPKRGWLSKSLTSLFHTLIENGSHPRNCLQRTRLPLSDLVSLQYCDGRLWGALNEPLIRLIRQQIECGDVFGLQVVPRAPLPLRSLYGTGAVKPFVVRRRSCCSPRGRGWLAHCPDREGGHVAMRFPPPPPGFSSPFHMQCVSYHGILLSLHKTLKTLWDQPECAADAEWAWLVYFDIPPEETFHMDF